MSTTSFGKRIRLSLKTKQNWKPPLSMKDVEILHTGNWLISSYQTIFQGYIKKGKLQLKYHVTRTNNSSKFNKTRIHLIHRRKQVSFAWYSRPSGSCLCIWPFFCTTLQNDHWYVLSQVPWNQTLRQESMSMWLIREVPLGESQFQPGCEF